MAGTGTHWLRFNLVGALGMAVQFTVLTGLAALPGMPYLLATALAVECAVLHNFFWHARWTWADRPSAGWRETFGRLVSFHVSNGLVSLVGNVFLMKVFHGAFHLPLVPSNAIAIVVCSLVNFGLAEWVVFQKKVWSLESRVWSQENDEG
jgi:putative flippase GtrA